MPADTGAWVQIFGSSSNRVAARLTTGYSSTGDTTGRIEWTLDAVKHPSDGSGFSASGTDDWQVSGADSASGTKSWSLSSPGQSVRIASGSYTVSRGSSSSSSTLTGKIFNVGPGTGDSTAQVTTTIPARAVDLPAPVTGLAATWVSDSRVDVTWTPHPTTAAPYDDLEVARWDNVTQELRVIGRTGSGSSTGYADTSVREDREYRYQVRPVNRAGAGTFPSPVTIRTRPKKPPAPVASRSGGRPVVRRPSPLSGVAQTWEIQHIEDGVDPGPLLASVPAGTASWAHDGASAASTHAYRARARVSNADGSSPASEWSALSATVQLQAPPFAPTLVGPPVADATRATALVVGHNSADSSPLRQAQARWRLAGTSTWTETAVVASEEVPIAAGTWSNGEEIEWSARAWGDDPDPSPWATPYARIETSATPVVSVVTVSPWLSPDLRIGWTYHDQESTAQRAWRARLETSGGVVLWSGSGTGAATGVDVPDPVSDGSELVAWAQVQDASGLWSDWDSKAITVEYAPPATPSLDAVFLRETAAVALTIHAGADGEVATESMAMLRATPDGWVAVATGMVDGQTVVDPTPPLDQWVSYRALSYAESGATAASEVAPVFTDLHALVLNHGGGWGQVVVLRSTGISDDGGVARTQHAYAGVDREWRATHSSPTPRLELAFNATLFAEWTGHVGEQPSLEAVRALRDDPGSVMVRDCLGHNFVGSLQGVAVSGYGEAAMSVSGRVVQDDWPAPDVVPL